MTALRKALWTWPTLLSIVSVTGLIVAAYWPLVGWPISLLGEALWAVYTVKTRQWGFLVAVVPYTVGYLLHLWGAL